MAKGGPSSKGRGSSDSKANIGAKIVDLEDKFDPNKSYNIKSSEPITKSQFSTLIILLGLVFLLIVVLGMMYRVGILGNSVITDNSNENENNQSEEQDTSQYDMNAERLIEITAPTEDSTEGGKVFATGRATAFLELLTIQLVDSKGVVVGESAAALAGEEKDYRNWSAVVYLVKTPDTDSIQLRVFPTTEGANSDIAQSVDIKLQESAYKGRLKITSPRPSQYVGGGEFTLQGEMKDFFEAYLNYRVLNAEGEIILQDVVQAQSDNYGQFAPFEEQVSLTLTSDAGRDGVLQFYDVSAKDGSEKVLLNIPVSFTLN